MLVAVVQVVARSCDPNTRLPPQGQASTLIAVEGADQLLCGADASSANAGVISAAIMSEAVQ